MKNQKIINFLMYLRKEENGFFLLQGLFPALQSQLDEKIIQENQKGPTLVSVHQFAFFSNFRLKAFIRKKKRISIVQSTVIVFFTISFVLFLLQWGLHLICCHSINTEGIQTNHTPLDWKLNLLQKYVKIFYVSIRVLL